MPAQVTACFNSKHTFYSIMNYGSMGVGVRNVSDPDSNGRLYAGTAPRSFPRIEANVVREAVSGADANGSTNSLVDLR